MGDEDANLLDKFNAGLTLSSLKGYYGKFHMWVNNNGMVNLLSNTCLKEEGYHIEYASDKKWFVATLQGLLIPIKRDTVLTKCVSYIDMR